MTNPLAKLQIRVTALKAFIGLLILMGLVIAYLLGTDRPRTFYAAIAATAFAVLFWGAKLILLLRDEKSS
jgi:hypothetical protein